MFDWYGNKEAFTFNKIVIGEVERLAIFTQL